MLLGLDLSASGEYTPQNEPSPAADVTVDGYTVTLAGSPQVGRAEPLLVGVRHDGQPVAVSGSAWLVLLRDGDLAYAALPADPRSADGTLRFEVTLPDPGRYAAYVDFTADGTAHTAAFTLPSP